MAVTAAHPGRRATGRCRCGGGTSGRVVGRAQLGSSPALRWLTQTVRSSASAATVVVDEAADLGQVRAPWASGGAGRRPRRARRGAHLAGGRPQAAGGHAVPQHAGRALEHEPGAGVATEQVGHVLGAADGVDHRARAPGRPRGRDRRGRQGVSTSRLPSPAGDLGQLVGADRQGVQPQPSGLAGQAPDGEPVAGLPFATGTRPGVDSVKARRWPRQRRRRSTVRVRLIRRGVSCRGRRPCRAAGSAAGPTRRRTPTASPPVPTLNWISPRCGSSEARGR